MQKPEYTIRSCQTKFNARDSDEGPIIDAYFAVYDTVYEPWPGEKETIAPGSFAGYESRDVRALIDHNTRLVLGRTKAGTMDLDDDDRGLHGIIKLNRNDTDAMNLYSRVQRGDVDQCSFGFDIDEIEYKTLPDGTTLSVIKHVILYEVSIVTFPAYAETSAQARSYRDSARRNRHVDAWKETMKRRLSRNGS